jgi:hypothetical protein
MVLGYTCMGDHNLDYNVERKDRTDLRIHEFKIPNVAL